MTLSEKYIIFQELIGTDFSWEQKFYEYQGVKYQLLKIDSESDGMEVFIDYKKVGSQKVCSSSLRVFNMTTHRKSYNKELMNAILKGLGRSFVKEVKECSDYFN